MKALQTLERTAVREELDLREDVTEQGVVSIYLFTPEQALILIK